MDHTGILRKAWRTAWTYRALWLFGVVLALVASSWTPYALVDRDRDRGWDGITVTTLPGETFWQALRRSVDVASREANQALSEVLAETLGISAQVNAFAIAAALVALVLAAIIVAKIARYVSETALIQMVGTLEETEERLTIRQGLRLGWSHKAWRLFLMDVLVDVGATMAVLALFVAILGPLPLWVGGSEGVIFTFAFLTGGLVLAATAVVIAGAVIVSVMKRLAHRACVLEDLGVLAAIRQGWRGVWQHLRDTGLMWLIVTGAHLTWTFVSAPLVVALIGTGLILGGLPGVAAGGLVDVFAAEDTAIAVGLALGVPLFLLILVAPLVLLSGLLEVFLSALWTLTYRELRTMQAVERETVPVLGPSSLKTAPAAS
jgi:hypothetical protein